MVGNKTKEEEESKLKRRIRGENVCVCVRERCKCSEYRHEYTQASYTHACIDLMCVQKAHTLLQGGPFVSVDALVCDGFLGRMWSLLPLLRSGASSTLLPTCVG